MEIIIFFGHNILPNDEFFFQFSKKFNFFSLQISQKYD